MSPPLQGKREGLGKTAVNRWFSTSTGSEPTPVSLKGVFAHESGQEPIKTAPEDTPLSALCLPRRSETSSPLFSSRHQVKHQRNLATANGDATLPGPVSVLRSPVEQHATSCRLDVTRPQLFPGRATSDFYYVTNTFGVRPRANYGLLRNALGLPFPNLQRLHMIFTSCEAKQLTA